jgi:hypothetical protein
MKSDPLNLLIKQARAASPPADDRVVTAPLGFASRVVALARAEADAASWSTFFERKAWRALGLAGAVAALSVGFNLAAISDSIEQEVLEAADPITALWELS